ncbi:MAG: DUF72 domain-containing protein [Chitinophagaceae bacterium]|nr:DUF72 domain-containing protein [Chitinophagaceae bacterium]
MEFGRVPVKELNKINFRLPKEPVANAEVLSSTVITKKARKLNPPKIHVGCAKWGRTEWVGKIYPSGTKEKDFLQHYVKHYNSIELNATHYKVYGPTAIRKWGEKAKDLDFVFCPKMYKGITHYGNFSSKRFITNEFLRGIRAFGTQLGPTFIQVNELFTPKRKSELFSFLETLPEDLSFFLEVRHPEWFANKTERADLFTFLKEHNIGAVITDTAGRRDCAHMHLTSPRAFIRYVGNSLHPTDYKRTDSWVRRIKYWLDHGLEELYFFMHMHDEAKSPELTIYLVEKLNKQCGLNLLVPEFSKETPKKKRK